MHSANKGRLSGGTRCSWQKWSGTARVIHGRRDAAMMKEEETIG